MGSALCGALAHITRNLNKKYELFEYDDEKVGRTNAARRRFEQLQLQPQDLQRLFNVFNNFCDEDEEFISYDQFCEVVGPEVASEANRMKLFDIVAAGKELLQFDDLVLSLWKYCACGRQTIFELAFRLCDADDSGVLEALEVQAMFQRLYGAKWKNLRHSKPELFKALTNNNPDRPSADIDVKAFTSIARGNLMLIAEALAAQRGLRRFGGLQYWKRQETLVATTGKGRAASAYDAFKSPPAFKRRTAPPAHDTHTPVEEFKPNHDRWVTKTDDEALPTTVHTSYWKASFRNYSTGVYRLNNSRVRTKVRAVNAWMATTPTPEPARRRVVPQTSGWSKATTTVSTAWS